MEADLVAFAAISFLSFLSVFFMIRAKRLMHSAIYLALFFVFTSGILAMLGAVFIAILQILIFVGGIVVLIVMVIMLSENGDEASVISELKSFKVVASTLLFVLVVFSTFKMPVSQLSTFSIADLSSLVMNNYGIAVLVSAIMLFSSLVASIFFLKGEKE